jgi:predicted MFS family arabinose efflux permease
MTAIQSVVRLYRDSFSGLSREIWLLGLVMLINRMGAMVLPFMSMYLTTSLHFTLAEAGFVMGFYGAGSILGAFFGGYLTDKYHYHGVQLWSLAGSSVFLFLIPFLHDFWTLSLAVFIFSCVSDTLRPANSVAISAYSREDNRVRSFSLMRLSINLGFAIGPALGGFILIAFGYKWIFIFDGITCLLAALLIVLYLPDKKADKTASAETIKTEETVRSPYKDTTYLIFIFLVMVYGTLFFQLFTTVPVFMKKISGYDESLVGLFMAMNGLIIALFEMPIIQQLEKKPNSFNLITFGFIFLAASFGFLLLHSFGIVFAILYVITITISEILAMPFMLNYAITRSGKSNQGRYMALYSMAYGMAHIAAPTISMPFAEQFGFQMLYFVVIFLSLVTGFWFYHRAKLNKW